MTRLECDICMQKGFSVNVSDNCPQKDYLSDKYLIVSAHKYRHKYDKKWEYSFGIAPESNRNRESYTVKPEYLEICEGFSKLLATELENTVYSNIKAYINELVAAGVIKTAIREKINKMLREAKKNE